MQIPEQLKKLLTYIDNNIGYGIEVLKKLIEIPTVNPPGKNYDRIATLFENLLEELGLQVKIVEVPRSTVEKYYPEHADHPRYIVLARLGETRGKPILHFNGHYDIVPPGPGWSHDPFKPVLDSGKLYGRGASDMKGGIASIILALKTLVANPPENIALEASFTPDEETGGETGVKYMLETGLVKPDYAVVAEPTTPNVVWIGNKGAVWLLVEVHGRQAHGSRPWAGDNAFEKMVELAHLMIHELKPRIEAKKSNYPYDEPEGAKATITLGGEVRGSTKVNIVPGYYAFSIDRRVIPEETPEEAAKEIIEFIKDAEKKIPGLKTTIKTLAVFEPAVISPDTPLAKTMAEAVKIATGKEPRLTVCIGGLDTRYFQIRGIQAVTHGPGDPKQAHNTDEYIEVENLAKTAKAYTILAHILGRQP